MEADARRLRAALLLAAGLALCTFWPERPAGSPCEAPASVAMEEGRTLSVRCDGHGPPVEGAARLLYGGGLDPNRADAASLSVLPGLGPGRAAAVVEARTHGAFRSVEDLRRVPGIGAGTVERLRPWLVFGDPPAPVHGSVDPPLPGK